MGDSWEGERIERARAEARAAADVLADSWTVERHLSPAEAKVVQDWFQFPMVLQTFSTLGLMVFTDANWWQALLLAWVISTPAAFLMKAAPTQGLLAVAKIARSVEWFVSIAAASYFIATGRFWDLIPAVAGLAGLLGMACPGFAIMSSGKGGLAPKAVFARRWFSHRFPEGGAAS